MLKIQYDLIQNLQVKESEYKPENAAKSNKRAFNTSVCILQ